MGGKAIFSRVRNCLENELGICKMSSLRGVTDGSSHEACGSKKTTGSPRVGWERGKRIKVLLLSDEKGTLTAYLKRMRFKK